MKPKDRRLGLAGLGQYIGDGVSLGLSRYVGPPPLPASEHDPIVGALSRQGYGLESLNDTFHVKRTWGEGVVSQPSYPGLSRES